MLSAEPKASTLNSNAAPDSVLEKQYRRLFAAWGIDSCYRRMMFELQVEDPVPQQPTITTMMYTPDTQARVFLRYENSRLVAVGFLTSSHLQSVNDHTRKLFFCMCGFWCGPANRVTIHV